MRFLTLPYLCIGLLSVSSLNAQGTMSRVQSDTLRGRMLARTTADSFTLMYSSTPRGRARIGVTISLAPGANDRFGALVESVVPRGPADLAGVRAGDIIAKVNDVAIGVGTTRPTTTGLSAVGERLIAELSSLQPGKVATLQLRRAEATITVKVTPDRDETVVATTIMSQQSMDPTNAYGMRMFFSDSSRALFDSSGRALFIRADTLRGPLRGITELNATFGRMGSLDSTKAGGVLTYRWKDSLTGVMRDSSITFGRTLPTLARRVDGTSLMVGELSGTKFAELVATQDSVFQRLRTTGTFGAPGRLSTGAVTGTWVGNDSLIGIERNMVMLRSSFDALSRLELAPVNKDLGSYFGTDEGVLVLSISPPGVLVVNGRAVTTEQRRGMTSATRAADAKVGAQGDAASSILSLKAGDIITAVDGRAVTTPAQLMRILRSYESSDAVKLSVVRQKKSITLQGKMPSE